jgi:uncharacterized protein
MKNIFLSILILLLNLQCQALRIAPFRTDSVDVKIAVGRLRGLLMVPNGVAGKIPLVIIVPGSGPTDMDGNNDMGLKSNAYALLARALADNKIATYRYDKRGIGLSADMLQIENDMKFGYGIDDVNCIIKMLRADERFGTITIVGHSEGSLVGMAAASNADKYVSLAGIAQSADITIKKQLKGKLGNLEKAAYKAIDSLKKGFLVKDVNPALTQLMRPSVQPYLITWFKYNPNAIIKNLNKPCLIINGTKDLQVETANAQMLKKAQPKAQLLIIKNMNHVLKTIEGDTEENYKSYADESLPINQELIDALSVFCK